jgi:hypothetical protein
VSGAGEMAHGVGKGSIDIRHSLGLVDNFIRGAHAQAMADLVRMYSDSALVMGALPIAATAAGIGLIGGIAYEAAEHVKKLKEEAEKLHTALTEQSTAGNNAFRSLDADILRAEQRADELRNDHLGALSKQLEAIDHQSMDELVKSFGFVQKAADAVFKELQEHWYTLGSGSTGPAHALDQFKVQYENLLSAGKDKEASDLLHGTLESAQKILQLQHAINDNRTGTGMMGPELKNGDAYYSAMTQLREKGIGYSKTEVESQKALVDGLQQQVGIETRVNELRKVDSGNASKSTGNEAAARRATAAKEAVDAQVSMGQAAIAADKATADAQLAVQRASIEARLQSDLDFASRDYQVKAAANQAEIAALNKTSNDYQLQLKTLHDKALSLEAQYGQQRAELTSRASIAENQRDIQAVETGIREQIDATREGTAERLAAIDAGIREEQARHLQDTSFYQGLLTQRVSAARQEAEEEKKLALGVAEASIRGREQAAQEEIRHSAAMAQIKRTVSSPHDLGQIDDAQKQATREYQAKHQALTEQLTLYRQAGQDKVKQAQQTEMQIALLDKQAADRSQELQTQKVQAMRSMWAEVETGYASMFMNVLEGHRSLYGAIGGFLDAAVSKSVSASLQVMAGNKSEQLSYAKTAAAGAYKSMAGIPFIGPELGAVAAAAVFAGAMAFEKGGIVPGVGMGDIVPAMLTPGEMVIPKSMTEHLTSAARSGSGGTSHVTHVHVRPTYNVQTIDGDGMNAALEKHSDQLQRHFENTLRKMNH